MGWGHAIGGAFEAWNRWRKSRRGRIRTTIMKLKEKKKHILKQPPTKGKVKKVEAIVKKIKQLERILNQE